MASSSSSSFSSSSRCTWIYNVFTSFHGPDVRKQFLSHLRKQFTSNGITMFDDERIVRSEIIAPALIRGIRESRISIVVLSRNYASSSWCLDELLEILKCKEEFGQIVMTVFYGVDPSDVRNQTGDFGIRFAETCARKTEEEKEEKKRKWSQALSYVGNIAGEHFKNWDSEADMIDNIARDVSNKLHVTPSKDFVDMVGLEAHLGEMESLLDLDYDGVKIVGISGPAGIGKSTIARALHSRLSGRFSHSYFMDNIRGSYQSGSEGYGQKLRLHERFLSEILNLTGTTIGHLGVVKGRLHDKKVLIILDDVECLDQLEALANIRWFGPGSRVIVTTENKEILQQHGINDIYHVGFPSTSEAQMIFCLSAFGQTSPPVGFMDLAEEVARICGNLPLGLNVLESSLRRKSHADWIAELPSLQDRLDGRIESVLKVGYERLHEKEQALFLHIAVFFNYEDDDLVTSMLAKTYLNVRLGLKKLTSRCLIQRENSKVVMHHLLQVMARQVISRQEPWKRQILVDAREICYALENAEGNGSVVGVSFDLAEINELKISARAFEKMYNLRLLDVYDRRRHRSESQVHIPEEMEFLPRLSLLSWYAYPRKSLPLRFCPENLVELHMEHSQLEKLWEGTQPLANLKKMDLSYSSRFNVLPDLSNATNLERLDLSCCDALVELPPSISNLYKLDHLLIDCCESLEVIPTLANLAYVTWLTLDDCSRLRKFPDIPTNTRVLSVKRTSIEELPASLVHCSHLASVDLSESANLKTFSTHLPTSVKNLNLCNSGIERITDCIKDLHNLQQLHLSSCKRLVALPELPCSLKFLHADDCESLERVSGRLNTLDARLYFTNCFKLGPQARRAIIQHSLVNRYTLLPGREVPAEFNHRGRGNSLTIPHSDFNRFKVCLAISPDLRVDENTEFLDSKLLYPFIPLIEFVYTEKLTEEHLLIFDSSLPFFKPPEVSRKIVLRFRSHGRFGTTDWVIGLRFRREI